MTPDEKLVWAAAFAAAAFDATRGGTPPDHAMRALRCAERAADVVRVAAIAANHRAATAAGRARMMSRDAADLLDAMEIAPIEEPS